MKRREVAGGIEFFFDIRSPYSYLAHGQLGGLGVEVALKPIKILDLMNQVNNVPTTITCEAKGRYAAADLKRWSRRYGMPIASNPDRRSNDGELCMRAIVAAASPSDAAKVTARLFSAYWGSGAPLRDREEVIAAIRSADIDADLIASLLDTAELDAELDANTAEAGARGAFGSPSIFVGDELFFGNDRMDFVREALEGAGR